MTLAISRKSTREEVFQYLSEQSAEDLTQLCQFVERTNSAQSRIATRTGAPNSELLATLNRATRPQLIAAIDACLGDELNDSTKRDAHYPGPLARGPWSPTPPKRSPDGERVTFRVYQITLHPDCVSLSCVRKQNQTVLASGEDPVGYFYVGLTAHTAGYRFWEHCRDRRITELKPKKRVKSVFRYGLELSAIKEIAATTRPEAELMEQSHADDLRERGFVVYSGHRSDDSEIAESTKSQIHNGDRDGR